MESKAIAEYYVKQTPKQIDMFHLQITKTNCVKT